MNQPKIAVILPCYNEEGAIAAVVAAFRRTLPEAEIFVFDNNSTDATAQVAAGAGAEVRFVRPRGKGNVIRQAFAQVDADVYVVADGDGTYDASRAPELIDLLLREDLDMVVGTRQAIAGDAYRSGHRIGNSFFNWVLRRTFGRAFKDIFSGYRVFSRAFIKSFPALSLEFETETEMSLHAIQLGLPVREVETAYDARIGGTESKLKTYRDGWRILWFIIRLVKHLRPLFLFASFAAFAALVSLALGLPVVLEFLETGLVPHLPTAIAAASIMIIAALSLVTGVILDGVAYAQLEAKRLAYLSVPRRRLKASSRKVATPARKRSAAAMARQ